MNVKLILYWALRIIAAVIMLQTLFFKFNASPESVYIFETVGMEPWGRIGTGVLELIASVLLLINRTAWAGAGIALGLMGGAIAMHFTLLGIEVQGDGGQLFIYALMVAFSAAYVLYVDRDRVLAIINKIKG